MNICENKNAQTTLSLLGVRERVIWAVGYIQQHKALPASSSGLHLSVSERRVGFQIKSRQTKLLCWWKDRAILELRNNVIVAWPSFLVWIPQWYCNRYLLCYKQTCHFCSTQNGQKSRYYRLSSLDCVVLRKVYLWPLCHASRAKTSVNGMLTGTPNNFLFNNQFTKYSLFYFDDYQSQSKVWTFYEVTSLPMHLSSPLPVLIIRWAQ